MRAPNQRHLEDPATDAGHFLFRLGLAVLVMALPVASTLSRRLMFTLLPVGALMMIAGVMLATPEPPEAIDVPGVAAPQVSMLIGPQPEQSFDLNRPLREARDAFEKSYFEFHLAQESGSMTRVAEKTGLERTHLYRKLKQLGVDLSRSKRGGL